MNSAAQAARRRQSTPSQARPQASAAPSPPAKPPVATAPAAAKPEASPLAGVGFNTDPMFVQAGQGGAAVPRGLAGVESARDGAPKLNFRSDRAYETAEEGARRAAAAAQQRSTLDKQVAARQRARTGGAAGAGRGAGGAAGAKTPLRVSPPAAAARTPSVSPQGAREQRRAQFSSLSLSPVRGVLSECMADPSLYNPADCVISCTCQHVSIYVKIA